MLNKQSMKVLRINYQHSLILITTLLLLSGPLAYSLSPNYSSLRTALIITGGTGSLGQAIIQSNLLNDHLILSSYRNEAKLSSKMEAVSSSSNNNVIPFQLKLDHIHDNKLQLDKLYNVLDSRINELEHVILVNNAAICLPTTDHQSLISTVTVNCYAPYLLTQALIQYILSNKNDTRTSDDNNKSLPRRLTVVNVSSGDGELVYLSSDIQREIASIHTLMVHMHIYILTPSVNSIYNDVSTVGLGALRIG